MFVDNSTTSLNIYILIVCYCISWTVVSRCNVTSNSLCIGRVSTK